MTARGLGRLTALCAVVSDRVECSYTDRVRALSPAKPIYGVVHATITRCR